MAINVEVELRERESTERLIRRFIKKVKKEGVLEEYRDRRYFKKKSDVKRLEKRRQKRLARQAQIEKENQISSHKGR